MVLKGDIKYIGYVIALLAIFALCSSNVNLCSSQTFQVEPVVYIEVYLNGAAHVTMRLSDVKGVEVNLKLIGAPEVDQVLVYDENSIPLPYNMSLDTIRVYPLGSQQVNVEYVTYSISSMAGGIWTVTIHSPYDFELTLPEGAEIVNLNVAPKTLRVQNNKITLSFIAGSIQVEYIIPASIPSRPPSAETPSWNLWYLVPIGVAAAIVFASAVVLLRRRKKTLSGVEAAIVSYLKGHGGTAFQDEIVKDLSLPKSTLSRAISSLKSKGVVEVKKVSRRNYVVLKREL